jgi:hypothetical protein
MAGPDLSSCALAFYTPPDFHCTEIAGEPKFMDRAIP